MYIPRMASNSAVAMVLHLGRRLSSSAEPCIFQHPPSFLQPHSSEDGTTWNKATESWCCCLVILLSMSVAPHRLHCPQMPQPPTTRLVSQRKDSEEEAILLVVKSLVYIRESAGACYTRIDAIIN